jgi:hypothetical protein
LVEANKKSFKKVFPHLAEELTNGENAVSLDSVRTDPEQDEKSLADKFHDYSPTVVDYIRRCSTEAEANEIIAFLEKRCEITEEYSEQLREQLRQKGLRSFGPKKEEDYYFKQSGVR